MHDQPHPRKTLILPIVTAVVVALAAAATAGPSAQAEHGLGGRIAFSHLTNGPEDIFTIAPDGTHEQQITHTPADQGGSEAPEWTPNGDKLLFDSDRAGNVHLFSTTLDGRVTQLTDGDGFEFSPAVSADGKVFAYEHDNADFTTGGIFVATRHGNGIGPAHQITEAPGFATGGFDTEPEFSPDGTKLVFLRVLNTERPTAQSAVFVIGIDGSGLTQLTPYELNATHQRWSPDGTQIAFSSNGDNFSDTVSANVYLLNADGTDLTPITQRANGAQAFTPEWAPDGHHLVFASAHPGDPSTSFELLDLDSGNSTVIHRSIPGTSDFDPAWSRN